VCVCVCVCVCVFVCLFVCLFVSDYYEFDSQLQYHWSLWNTCLQNTDWGIISLLYLSSDHILELSVSVQICQYVRLHIWYCRHRGALAEATPLSLAVWLFIMTWGRAIIRSLFWVTDLTMLVGWQKRHLACRNLCHLLLILLSNNTWRK